MPCKFGEANQYLSKFKKNTDRNLLTAEFINTVHFAKRPEECACAIAKLCNIVFHRTFIERIFNSERQILNKTNLDLLKECNFPLAVANQIIYL